MHVGGTRVSHKESDNTHIDTDKMTSIRSLESVLDSLCKYSANQLAKDADVQLSEDIAFLMDATTNKEHLRAMSTHRDGQSISALLDLLRPTASVNGADGGHSVDILYKTLMILGRALSVCPRSVLHSRFVEVGGVSVVYDEIVLSAQHSVDEDMVYSMVDFACSLAANREHGRALVVDNSEHRFLFQMSMMLSKRPSFSLSFNHFASLLCTLYRDDHGHSHKEEALDDDGDDDDDDDNIRSIVDTLILTGFLQAVIKRTATLKTGSFIHSLSLSL